MGITHSKELSVLIAEIRRIRGYTFRQMAKKLEVPLATYWRLEHGKPAFSFMVSHVLTRLEGWTLPTSEHLQVSDLRRKLQ